MRGAWFRAPAFAGMLLLALLAPTRAWSSAFCDCCCNAAAGNRAPCAACDIDGNGTVSLNELSLLGCASDPICAPLFPATPSPTPTLSACVGDCHGTGQVTIGDILIMVNVLLGTLDVGGCRPGDANGDGTIAINEIVSAVANALDGCPSPPATATATAFQPRPTLTAASTGTTVRFTATAAVSPSAVRSRSGSVTATTTASPPPSATRSETQSATAVPTGTSSATLVPMISPTATATSPSAASETPTRSATATPSTPTVSATTTATRTPTATGAATATPTPTLTATAIPTPTLTAASALYCDSLSEPALIPDYTPSGIDNTIAVPSGTIIADLNVQLDINHTYVGDLVVTLKHIDTGTTVTLIDRPGTTPALPAGCDGSDISCTLDDQAGRVAQNECRSTAPAIDGSVKPTDALAAFAGQAAGGTWRLNVSDNAPDDVGSLSGWCLVVNSAAPVVTAYTCEGDEECTLNIGDSFTQSFSFTAPHGATSWRITRNDGQDVGSGMISPPSTGGTIPLTFTPFICQNGPCGTTEFDYSLVVTDALGADSPRARVHIVVLGNA